MIVALVQDPNELTLNRCGLNDGEPIRIDNAKEAPSSICWKILKAPFPLVIPVKNYLLHLNEDLRKMTRKSVFPEPFHKVYKIHGSKMAVYN